jgi:hypothetical protein
VHKINLSKKKFLFTLLLSVLLLVPFCKKEEAVFLHMTDMFPYMVKQAEVHQIAFGEDLYSDQKYLIQGWESFNPENKKEISFRLTEGPVSLIQFFLTSLSDIKIIFNCEPQTKEERTILTAEVSINGRYLQEERFSKERNTRLKIPSSFLKYGTNTLTFQWQDQGPPVRFYSMKIQRSDNILQNQTREEISVAASKEEPAFQVPRGAILEYYVNLPKNPVLKFGLSSNKSVPGRSTVHIAVYNEKGEKSSNAYSIEHSEKVRHHKLRLKEFEKETIKIIFSNDIVSDPNTLVSWVNPVISSSSQKSMLTIWEAESLDSVRSFSKQKQEESNNKKPHVFIYLPDTVRADHLGIYKYWRATSPYLYEFSKDSLLFNNCFANASWTKAAVGSILTGLYPNKHHGEDEREKVSNEAQFLSEILRTNGYSTVYLTSNGNASSAFNFDQGNDFYKLVGKERKNQFYSSKEINSEFFKLIEDNPGLTEKPLFAFLHTIDPHDPYTPKAPFLKFVEFDKTRQNLRRVRNALNKKYSGTLSQKDLDYMMSLYDCEILHNDHSFGKFIEFLKSEDLYEDSMIIFVSDHGEQFHEHGNFRHGRSIYNEEIHVPLVIKFPGGKYGGTKSDVYVSQVDILPTILDYLDINIPPEVDGINILTLMNRPEIR